MTCQFFRSFLISTIITDFCFAANQTLGQVPDLVSMTKAETLLGKKDLGAKEFPPVETTFIDGEIAFHKHSGGHTPAPNWPTFLTFATRYFK